MRLDTAQMASNADLIAIKGRKRVSIQVKATDLAKQRVGAEWLTFGYSTGFLRDKRPIFNSKKSTLIADVIIAVGYRENASTFIVLPVAIAERLCRMHARYWSRVPAKKKDTGKLGNRSQTFPLYLAYTANSKPHRKHHSRMKRNLRRYENAWEILDAPIEKLHRRQAWQPV